MQEFQAYFFMAMMYPFIYFYSQLFVWYHIGISVMMLLWLMIDPSLLIEGYREDGTGIPKDNYAMIYAEVDAITGVLYGDFNYLYYGKQAYEIGFLSILNHLLYNIVFLFTVPIVAPLMFPLMFISAFQLLVLYLYVNVLKEPET